MSTLFNEAEADAAVAAVLSRKKERKMIPLFKDENGKILQATQTDEITREELVLSITEAEDALTELRQALQDYDALATVENVLPETPEPVVAEEPVVAVQPETPTISPEPVAIPVQTPEPQPQPEQPTVQPIPVIS